jgi:SAM-dependent methyltransferase
MGSLRSAWEAHADEWIRFARAPDHDHFFWRFGMPRFLEMLPPPGRLTVDIGCGEGRLTRILRDRGHRVAGFDGSPTLARAAADHGEAVPVVVADAAELPVKARAADLAVAYMTLMDIDDLAGAVREAARVLGSGGRFCMAIVHPMQTSGDFGDEVIDGVRQASAMAPRGFELTHPYFVSRRFTDTIERDGIRMTFNSEHRPIESYARALEDAGFLIETFREPAPDPEMIEQFPRTARFADVPWALFVRAIRAIWAS